jgi:U3 small nucleolar RNA-associated protein 14
MTEKDIEATESLAMNNLTIEEVAARRAELSRMRELMFRAEAKNKRVAKIKSKAYRKIAKKEREKNAQKIEEAGFNLDADPEEAQLEQERKRATERATLRHKNTGKWAKSMLGRAELDVDQRRELNEQLEQGDRLKKKIQNYGEDGEDDDSSSEEEGDDIDAVRQRAFDDLEALDGEDAVAGGAAGGGKKKKEGLFEMKFMQDGMARAQAGADRDANDLRREFGGGRGEDEEDEDLGARPAYTTVDGNRGRQVYGQTTVPVRTFRSFPRFFSPPRSLVMTFVLFFFASSPATPLLLPPTLPPQPSNPLSNPLLSPRPTRTLSSPPSATPPLLPPPNPTLGSPPQTPPPVRNAPRRKTSSRAGRKPSAPRRLPSRSRRG